MFCAVNYFQTALNIHSEDGLPTGFPLNIFYWHILAKYNGSMKWGRFREKRWHRDNLILMWNLESSASAHFSKHKNQYCPLPQCEQRNRVLLSLVLLVSATQHSIWALCINKSINNTWCLQLHGTTTYSNHNAYLKTASVATDICFKWQIFILFKGKGLETD